MDEFPKPQKEHEWLLQLVGEWEFEGDCAMGPDQPRMRSTGTERVRSIGGFWTVGEGASEIPGTGVPTSSIMTLGFDSATGRFVGSFIASMMTKFWTYDGFLDEGGKKLVLEAEGPNMVAGGTALYRDVIEIVGPDHRRLVAHIQGEDGGWTEFMTADYRRVA